MRAGLDVLNDGNASRDGVRPMDHDFIGLTVDLGAVRRNWSALAAKAPQSRTGAVVKADAYGLGAQTIAATLYEAGARDFFVAQTPEGHDIRASLPADARIFVMEGLRQGDTPDGLIPVINSPAQWFDLRSRHPSAEFAVQLDTGMSRLGFAPGDWSALRQEIVAARPRLIMSHLYCADEPDHVANARQLAAFLAMTDGCGVPRSLAATGGILLGPDYHFDITRPGIGLYGAEPFAEGEAAVALTLPVIQNRRIESGTDVGYGATFTADAAIKVATIGAGYADGLPRSLDGRLRLWSGGRAFPIIGRVSMDAITIDVSGLDPVPAVMEAIGPHQHLDEIAAQAGTIGHEMLTNLGKRYARRYL